MATEKTCFKCLMTKPLTDFYKHPYMADGHLGKCKECAKIDAGEHRSTNIEKIRQYDRERATLPHRIEQAKRVWTEWKKAHPERRSAHMKVHYALRSGRLERLPCWICGEKAEAHHPDYSMPLEVVWLCPAHHKQAHAMAREEF